MFQLVIFFLNVNLFINCWPEFQLYTQRNPTLYERVDDLSKSVFYVPSVEVKFLIHGFGDNGLTTDLLLTKNEILLKENVNVIIVNWRDGASMPNYMNAASNTQIVGSKVGLFILTNNINPKNVHCIGHSLGAHTCGFAGKVIKLRRISGLDPAGPFFKGNEASARLDKSDADFVDIIHVDSFYGIQQNIGHADFYPSGGKSQPGCGISGFIPWAQPYVVDFIETSQSVQGRLDPVEIVACSHVKVPFYYAESVNSKCKFTSVSCNDFDSYKNGKCKCNLRSNTNCTIMGYHSEDDPKSGTFYLDVNKESPFCRYLYKFMKL